MSLVVAAIVPVSQDAQEALASKRNQRWAVPASALPASLKTAIDQGSAEAPDRLVVVYDLGHVHKGDRTFMKIGRARNAQVQLESCAELDHARIGFDATTGTLTLTNSSPVRKLFVDPSRDAVPFLAPGASIDLVEPTTFTVCSYEFRIFLGNVDGEMLPPSAERSARSEKPL